jgi:hypothetical protein
MESVRNAYCATKGLTSALAQVQLIQSVYLRLFPLWYTFKFIMDKKREVNLFHGQLFCGKR